MLKEKEIKEKMKEIETLHDKERRKEGEIEEIKKNFEMKKRECLGEKYEESVNKTIVDETEKRKLEEWTQKRYAEVLFNSNYSNSNQNTSVFDSKIMNKSNLLFIIEDTNNNKFGYYFNGTVTQCEKDLKGNGSFLFSLKSSGRDQQEMFKFEEKQECKGLYIYNKANVMLFGVSNGFWIRKEDRKSFDCEIYQNNDNFDFHNVENVFPIYSCSGIQSDVFNPKQISVIQMN